MKTVLLLGGFLPGQSLWSIERGFAHLGCRVFYLPTRGCIESHREPDLLLAREEADIIPEPGAWKLPYATDAEFQDALCAAIEQQRPALLLWWFSKDDRPPGLVAYLREQYPWCKTVPHPGRPLGSQAPSNILERIRVCGNLLSGERGRISATWHRGHRALSTAGGFAARDCPARARRSL